MNERRSSIDDTHINERDREKREGGDYVVSHTCTRKCRRSIFRCIVFAAFLLFMCDDLFPAVLVM